jgi:hypothetical protein
MAASMSRRAVQTVAAAQATLGAVLAVRPGAVHRVVGEPERGGPPAWIVQLLGGRMLVQAAVEAARPRRRVVHAAAAVDVLHALSMVGAAVTDARYRRPACVSAALAGLSAIALLATSDSAVG